jgi:hypothetical protein
MRTVPAYSEIDLATLSALGLSPALMRLALALRRDGQSLDEVAIVARKEVNSLKNFVQSRGLFARSRRRPIRK